MTNTLDHEMLLDFRTPSSSVISLSEPQLAQARQFARQAQNDRQWQTYLNHLSILGFESWLQERATTANEFDLKSDESEHFDNAISLLTIGEFKICLLTQGILNDEVVTLPKQVISNIQATTEEQVADYYVLVTVDEEEEEITIDGLITRDRVYALIQSGELILDNDDRTYDLPLSHLDFDINHLLFYLRFLEPSSIENAILENTSTSVITEVEKKPLFINIASWIEGKLDEVSENLSGLLFANQQLAMSAFRSQPTLPSLLDELKTEGILINDNVTVVLPVQLGENSLKIYAFPSLLNYNNEWSLVLAVGKVNETSLPIGLELKVTDESQILSSQEIEPDDNLTYIYTQVIAEFGEQLTATISLNTGETIVLPSFGYFQD